MQERSLALLIKIADIEANKGTAKNDSLFVFHSPPNEHILTTLFSAPSTHKQACFQTPPRHPFLTLQNLNVTHIEKGGSKLYNIISKNGRCNNENENTSR